jgi:hypothetical protein
MLPVGEAGVNKDKPFPEMSFNRTLDGYCGDMRLAWKVLKMGGPKGVAAKVAFVLLAEVVHRTLRNGAPGSERGRSANTKTDDLVRSASDRAMQWIHENDVSGQLRDFIKEVAGTSKILDTKLTTKKFTHRTSDRSDES